MEDMFRSMEGILRTLGVEAAGRGAQLGATFGLGVSAGTLAELIVLLAVTPRQIESINPFENDTSFNTFFTLVTGVAKILLAPVAGLEVGNGLDRLYSFFTATPETHNTRINTQDNAVLHV